jgi:hypothetical protein
MRSATDAFKALKNQLEQLSTILLVEIEYQTDPTPLYKRYTNYPAQINFNGLTWEPAPILEPNIGENLEGEIETIDLTIAAAGHEIASVLEDYILEGQPAKLYLVHRGDLTVGNALQIDMVINAVTIKGPIAIFSLSPEFDALGVELPRKTFTKAEFPAIPGVLKYV